ncbi:hypothetical protein BQ8420_15695 [Nocardiopsis sp. JB363]|nr:hypothetical protein BQ8420_15695 [Nocardiopsis sp. JB363]
MGSSTFGKASRRRGGPSSPSRTDCRAEPLRRDRDPHPDHASAPGRVRLWFRLRLRLPERRLLQLRRELRLTPRGAPGGVRVPHPLPMGCPSPWGRPLGNGSFPAVPHPACRDNER